MTLLGQSFDYAFGPDTVGTAVADHKAFLAVASGSSVSLGFEDMAGQPGCDYDYNDRTWGGVSVAGADDPVVDIGPALWVWVVHDAVETRNDGNTATVRLQVTRPDAETFRWRYSVTNDSLCGAFPSPGLGAFSVGSGSGVGVSKLYSSLPGWDGAASGGGASWNAPQTVGGPFVAIGQTEVFGFDTPQTPVVAAAGGVNAVGMLVGPVPFEDGPPPQRESIGTTNAGGPAKGPGIAFADITIDGDLTVGATNPKIPDSGPVVVEFSPNNDTNEDIIGGLVVMKSNSNNAPRQQITIQKLKDAAGQPVIGGKVEVTWAGAKVELYDVETGGNKVPSGTVYNNEAGVLPKKLWVQGVEGVEGGKKVTGSGEMRDVKIKAEPVGNAAGADDVLFTVLWVDVTVAFKGKVSDDNDKRQAKKDVTFDADGKNTDALGISKTVLPDETRIGWSLEGRGLVHPADFSYPGSDLRLQRVWARKLYFTPPTGAGEPITSGSSDFAEDSSLPGWLDNNPLDSDGYIYDLDNPGLRTSVAVSNQAQGTTARFRANFRQFAAITINGINTRPSGIYAYYVRFSLEQKGVGVTNKWAVIDPPDIVGDKEASGPTPTNPGLTNLTADLK